MEMRSFPQKDGKWICNDEELWQAPGACLPLIICEQAPDADRNTFTTLRVIIIANQKLFHKKSKKYSACPSTRPIGFYARSAILCCLLKAAIFRLLAYCSVSMQGRGPIHGDGLSR